MSKFLVRLLFYVLSISIIVFIIAGRDNSDRGTNNDHNVLKIAHASAFDSLDILFLGNSYCYSSIYNPIFDSLGRRTFNLGIASAGPEFYSMLLEDYLSSIKKKPDTVMLLVSSMSFSGLADRWVDYPIHRYLNKTMTNEELVVKYRTFGDYLPMLVNSVRKGLNNLTGSSTTDNNELNKIFRYKGLYIDSTITSDSVERSIRYAYLSLKEDVFNEESARRLTALADNIKAQGMQVIFFEVPTYKLHEYFSEAYLKEYQKYLEQISKHYRLIREIKMEPQFFRNIDHTNTQGAYQYTKYLINELSEPKQ